jgi:hypothetical protein
MPTGLVCSAACGSRPANTPAKLQGHRIEWNISATLCPACRLRNAHEAHANVIICQSDQKN